MKHKHASYQGSHWTRAISLQTFYLLCAGSHIKTPSRNGRQYFHCHQQGCIYFPKIWQPPKNSGIQQRDMKPVPHSGCTDIRRHCTEFSHLGFLHRWSSIKVTNQSRNVHGSLGHSEGTFISSSRVLLLIFFRLVIHSEKATVY